MAKEKNTGKDILNNILTAFYELDIYDKEEGLEILRVNFSDSSKVQSQLSEKILKIKRDAIIRREKERRDKLSLYEQAKKLYESIPNINEVLKQIFSESESKQFKLAFRSLESGNPSNLDDIEKEMLLLKFIQKLKQNNGENTSTTGSEENSN